jgi:hypothetical protein
VDANENVTAVFVCSGNYELATSVEGEGSVSLSPSGGSYACNAETTVTLTATEDSGWTFDHWEGDASGSANPVDVEMKWHRYVKAVFVCTASYTLDTSAVGGGSVTLDPSGGTYSCGDQVNIIPVPDPGWAFSGWTGDLSGSDQPGKVKMDGNRSVTATFVTGYAVSTATVGEGTVVGGGSYPAGSTAKLKALPDVGWSFDGWSGDLSGLANPASLPMNGNKAVTATFVEVFPVTIIGGDTEAGSVAQVPPPRAFGTYETGTEVTLTATKETYTGKNKSNIDLGYDYVFSHWTGLPSAQFPTGPHGAGTSNSNPVTYEVVGPTTVEAVWTKRYELTRSAVVYVDGIPVDFPFGSVTPATGMKNEGVTVSVNAIDGTECPDNTFDHWEGALSGSTDPVNLVMNGPKHVIAVFDNGSGGDSMGPPEITLDGDGTVTVGPDRSGYYLCEEIPTGPAALNTLRPTVTWKPRLGPWGGAPTWRRGISRCGSPTSTTTRGRTLACATPMTVRTSALSSLSTPTT